MSGINLSGCVFNITITNPVVQPGGGGVHVGCTWVEIHHVDDQGRHWCPTGIAYCEIHDHHRQIDGTCILWGSQPP